MIERILNFLIRPKISESQAAVIMQKAASERGWEINPPDIERELGCYMGIARLRDGSGLVVVTVDSMSGTVGFAGMRSDR
jgi:hypothetical protein